ncbi:MAG: glycosyltransferase family 2 protein [Candidatus Marinimicrobia bacterium]|jgi:glycosyltransferase involved in cell wall biosynthesis|nr:glycosyltransferase family 2 protein [Candidatus Neomarinimicrobiota bacterium]MDP6853662.1 glycosyltransferase family 2 protein [Candidatus Neomarinimicrobiota bacterium]
MSANPSLSIIIPVFNEEESLNTLYDEITTVIGDYSAEILFIDDGSTDSSFNIICSLADKDNRVKGLQLYKNFGKADALSEGFQAAEGEVVITMDADLQDDPAEIPILIAKIEEGWDMVSGWKKDRKDPANKRIPSKFFNFVTRLMTGIHIHDFNCGLKAYRRKVVKAIDVYGGMHRYIPALAGQKGFKVTEITVNHRPREFGVTKYGGNRFFHGFFDLFTMLFTGKYFDRPLHFFGLIGLLLFTISGICEFYALYDKLINGVPFQIHFALIVFGAMVFGLGLWFFSIGLLGELFIKNAGRSGKRILRTYHQNS